MTAALFLGLVLLVAAGIVVTAGRWGTRRMALGLAAAIVAWLAYVGVLGATGVVADPTMRPPAILALAVPIVGLAAWTALSEAAARIALGVPIVVLIGTQVYRLAVELLLHRLWQEGMVPRMLTFEGANLDILVGISAPFAAWVATRGRAGAVAALVWSVAGLGLLANVVVRAVLTAPGGLHLIATEVPNRLPGTFPYIYLAGFLAPLALFLHLLAIRALRRRLSSNAAARATAA